MASDINAVMLTGNLTRDVEISYLQSGSAVGNFSMAVNRAVKQGEQRVDETSFFDVSLFGKSAEALKPYLTKGKSVSLIGLLKQDRWQDKESGQTHSRVKVIAEKIKLGGGGGNAQQGGQAAPSTGFKEDIPYGEPSDIPF